MARSRDLTEGNITAGLWSFAIPLMFGNVLQQLYNLADTWIVGRYLGENALAAVGSSYTLMTFLTSIIIGLCLGSSAFLSISYGKKDGDTMRNGLFLSFVFIAALTLLLSLIVYAFLPQIIIFLQVPSDIVPMITEYLWYVMWGFGATFLYNYISNAMRSIGNATTPLCFLGISVVLNIALDFYFVAGCGLGVRGAAVATVIAQVIAGVGIAIYFILVYPEYRLKREDITFRKSVIREIFSLSGLTCLQQSIMNLGILLVQGLVNSFGAAVMAAFAVAVKIDTIAYMPVQDFGNAFSVFVAQNYGAGKGMRIRQGIRKAGLSVILFCLVVSTLVYIFARPLMAIFVGTEGVDVIAVGVQYLRIEGAFYVGIGILFMLYGYYRAVRKPMMSVVLTIISLGSRVALAYILSSISVIGVKGIWAAIPIGWFLADVTGIAYYLLVRRSVSLSPFEKQC